MRDNQSLLCAAASHMLMDDGTARYPCGTPAPPHGLIEDLIEEDRPAHASSLLEGVQLSVLRMSVTLALGL